MKVKQVFAFLTAAITLLSCCPTITAIGAATEYMFPTYEDYLETTDSTFVSAGYNSELESAICKGWISLDTSIDLTRVPSKYREIDYVLECYWALLYVNAQFFYIGNSLSYGYSGNYVTRISYNLSMNDTDLTESEVTQKLDEFYQAVYGGLSVVKTSWSDLDKSVWLHNYICELCYYDNSLSKYTAYDALVGGSSVCMGYALAYCYMLNLVGVSCNYVSTESINHIWNSVIIDGVKYNVDVTWDDSSISGVCDYSNFLISDTEKLKIVKYFYPEGVDDWTDASGNPIEEATSTRFENYAWSYTTDELKYYNGMWYFASDDGYNSTITAIKLDDSSDIPAESLFTADDAIWYEFNESYYYSNSYMKVEPIYGRVYYSLAEQIRSIAIDGSDDRLEYSLTDSELSLGYCYDIEFRPSDPDKMYYRFGETYSEADNESYFTIEVPAPVYTSSCTSITILTPFKASDDSNISVSGADCEAVITTLDEDGAIYEIESITLDGILTADISPFATYWETSSPTSNNFSIAMSYNGENTDVAEYLSNGGTVDITIVQPGDVDLDNTVTTSDSAMILNYLDEYTIWTIFGGDEPVLNENNNSLAMLAADFDKNGEIGTSDVSMSLTFNSELTLALIMPSEPDIASIYADLFD